MRILNNTLYFFLQTSELLFACRKLTASEALQHGLVTRVLWPDKFQEELIPIAKAVSKQSSQVSNRRKSCPSPRKSPCTPFRCTTALPLYNDSDLGTRTNDPAGMSICKKSNFDPRERARRIRWSCSGLTVRTGNVLRIETYCSIGCCSFSSVGTSSSAPLSSSSGRIFSRPAPLLL